VSDKLTNKPVTPSREMLELLKSWAAPDVTEVKKAEIVGKTNFMGVPIEEMYSRLEKEEEPDEEVVEQLTAEEIEQIRQDAYNEGFEQGKEDGFSKGHEEGLESGKQEGLEQGIEEGLQQGLEQGLQQIEAKAERWEQLTEQLYNPIERVDAAAEQQLLNLAVMLTESVLRSETKSNKEALLNVLHEAIASLPFNTEYAELHLHPDDIELLTEIYDEEAMAERKWILKPEPGYQLGDLVVATPNSLIDRTVKQRIKQTIEPFVQSALKQDEKTHSESNDSDETELKADNVENDVASTEESDQPNTPADSSDPRLDTDQPVEMSEQKEVPEVESDAELENKDD
jgi:flagellar assembly protein FliH